MFKFFYNLRSAVRQGLYNSRFPGKRDPGDDAVLRPGSTSSFDKLRTLLTRSRAGQALRLRFDSALRLRSGLAPRFYSGQVAVVLIVVIAVGLVLFAASVNYTLLSQSKTLTMKAAAASSSVMASQLASYGERLFREQLGGVDVRCFKSKGFSLLGIIVMVVIAVFAPEIVAFMGVEAGAVAGMVQTLRTAAIVGAIMEGASMMIAASAEPNLADMWNRMQNANLSQTGQFLERGIQAALQNSVTDQVKMPDLYDLDMDGLYGFEGNDPARPRDTISRFSLYNTKRFLNLPGTDTSFVENFLNALNELTLRGADGWGLWDPVYFPSSPAVGPAGVPTLTRAAGVPLSHPCFQFGSGTVPAECDICCQDFTDIGGVPAYCFPPGSGSNTGPDFVTQIGDAVSCAGRSPFRAGGNEYPLVYDPAYEDSTNNFFSFREQLGRDDEHHLYHTAPANPNWHGDPINGVQTLNAGLPDQGFFLKDNVGYYVAPGFANLDQWVFPNPPGVNPPQHPKLFPFLYKMKDWGPELALLNNYTDPDHCYMCDTRSGLTCTADYSPEIGQLDLRDPRAPNPLLTLATYSGGWCTDRVNKRGDMNQLADIGPNDPPLVSDNVTGLPADTYVPDDTCAINPALDDNSPLSQYVEPVGGVGWKAGWKAGADRYCSPTAPYDVDCPKHGVAGPTTTENAQCGQTIGGVSAAPPDQWVDDMLDEFIYGQLPAMFGLVATLEQQRRNIGLVALSKTAPDWYPPIGDLIEPPCPNPGNCPGSYTKAVRPGAMYVWREILQYYNSRIQTWLRPAPADVYVSSACQGPAASWCVPPQPGGAECAGVSAGEAATFDANTNGLRGDLYDVLQCLDWNANDPVLKFDGTPYQVGGVDQSGNAAKFELCATDCRQEHCENLPRSLVPSFYDGSQYDSGQPAYVYYPGSGDYLLFNTCLNSGTISECAANCALTTSVPSGPMPAGPPYDLPNFVYPDSVRIQDIDDWCAPGGGGVGAGAAPRPNSCDPVFTGGQTDLVCNASGLPGPNEDACRCSWAKSCGGFAGCSADTSYFDEVTAKAPPPNDSCADPVYLAVMQDSANEARIQVEKFKHRLQFLQGRFDEAMTLANTAALALDPANTTEGVLPTAIQRITDFLDGGDGFANINSPAERFIDAMSTQQQAMSGDLPAFAIYVWQDRDPERTNLAGEMRNEADPGRGYWHAVKVETRIPRRCDSGCVASDWPIVRSSQSGGGFLKGKTICYHLENRTGVVESRVIRFDQDKDLRGLVFPGGQQIWRSRSHHPLVSTPPGVTGGIRETCDSLIDPDLAGWIQAQGQPNSDLGAAFMLNRVPAFGSPAGTPERDYEDCWVAVHQWMLNHGVQSESCAEYYFAGNAVGFRVRFVPCGDWQ